MGIGFLVYTLCVAMLFYRHPGILLLGVGVCGALATGICLSRYIDIRKAEAEKKKGRRCRMCGQRRLAMALTFGEDEGLCRECLDELLPLLEKGKQK